MRHIDDYLVGGRWEQEEDAALMGQHDGLKQPQDELLGRVCRLTAHADQHPQLSYVQFLQIILSGLDLL